MPVDLWQLDNAIRTAIPVEHLEIKDRSSGCGENYAIVLVSKAFSGKKTLARHRMINNLLKTEIAQMHAFSQKTFTPEQYDIYLGKRDVEQ